MRISSIAFCAFAVVVLFVSTAGAAPCPLTASGTKYPIKIETSPPGATIYFNDKTCSAGTTPWSGKITAGEVTINAELAGYDLGTRTVKVIRSRKTQEFFLPLTKKAEPPKIEVKADADPKGVAGAQVWLDGEMKGQAPVTVTTTEGRHLLQLKKDGFETYETWISATTNNTSTLLPQMKEVAKPKFGTIVVEADVADAEVYIDGNKHPDNTPAMISNVIEGLHVIEVRKAPSLPWKQTVQVKASETTKVRADLQSTMHGGVGVVRVLSDAPGARAFLDGTDMGPVPVDIKDVKAGDHIVQVKAPSMQTGEKTVKVAAGSSQIVKFDLNSEAPADSGLLKVVSMVPEAQVFIDGAAVGKVPVEKRLSQGEHPVVVRLDGYKQFEQKVRVEAGQTVTVQASLKPVGRLRILSTPAQAQVVVNGLPIGKTPLDQEVEVGETVVRIEMAGFQPFEQTLTIEGGKTQTLSRELAIAGLSESELASQQRGLSSFGARTLPRGRSTVDLMVGYPYYVEAKINVGAGKIAKKFGFDAGVGVRSFLARNELGIGGRAMLADQDPFSAGIFTDLWWGSRLLDDSRRNGLTWNVGAAASLTALSHVTITGRLYANIWSDRHCPEEKTTSSTGFDGDPIQICVDYKNNTLMADERARINKLTTGSETETWDFSSRESGIRLMASVIAEIAFEQRWNIFGILEGAPFQEERALFTNDFSGTMPETDYNLYLQLGLTYKF
ncbi:MAG TPA: PEGA domain-containing protein [Kofleriaceae bacterium]|nr:PEGA domain-containing protein [Kofleriaceae bacterium]